MSFEGVNGTLRETHAARQLQESSWALKIYWLLLARPHFDCTGPTVSDCTLYFT
jgi:hypothetical protein